MLNQLADKKIVLGVTGCIAAYKALDLASLLIKEGAQIKVIMTSNAIEFLSPVSFEAISGNPVYTEMFARTGNWEIDHISLAKWADLFVVAPATANILGKVSHGIADDLLSTTIMATGAKVIFAPAMNTKMYENTIVKDNIAYLTERGYGFIPPAKGRLACGDWGEGKLADVNDILTAIKRHFISSNDLKGLKVLITAGPTREYIDPARFISNPSSGKMGYAIAEACIERGAKVDLVTGPVYIKPPQGAIIYDVETAEQMLTAVLDLFNNCDILFKTAAVGDFRPIEVKSAKIKKGSDNLSLQLVKNPDILKEAGKMKSKQIIIGFAAETENIEEYSKNKMKDKNLDFILANDISMPDAGFGSDTNQGILFTNKGECIHIPMLSKKEFAHCLIDEVIKKSNKLNSHKSDGQ